MNVNNLLDLYTDYLLITPKYATATGLSSVTGNQISHDKITRLLSNDIDSSTLWNIVKPMIHEIQHADGVLIIDDSIEPKPFSKQNSLINWHYDHCSGRTVKGVNFVSSFYYSSKYEMGLPVGVEYVNKTEPYQDKKGRTRHRSLKTKNEMMRDMIFHASNQIDFKYVLADSWFSSSENLRYISKDCQSNFVIAIKTNRLIALSKEKKEKGEFISIKELELEGRAMSVYLKQYEEPVLITKQVFKNGGGVTGTLYLITNDLNLNYDQITTIYEKRWKVEEFFRSIKSNAGFAKSPTKKPKTQQAHFTASMIAFVKMERLKIRNNQNHYAMKNLMWIEAAKAAWTKLDELSTNKLRNAA